uniref:Uncharacterized protein n=1 Tax=viral metagenome TaxID=1070528 RepID=A0A6C0KDL1_9ZZZZ
MNINDRQDHTEKWYTFIDKEKCDDKLQNLDEKYDEKVQNLDEKYDEKVQNLEEKIEKIEHQIKEMDEQIHYLTNNNLKLINRLLEAEISLERAKNSLVRNHIPFPFSSSLLTRKFSM